MCSFLSRWYTCSHSEWRPHCKSMEDWSTVCTAIHWCCRQQVTKEGDIRRWDGNCDSRCLFGSASMERRSFCSSTEAFVVYPTSLRSSPLFIFPWHLFCWNQPDILTYAVSEKGNWAVTAGVDLTLCLWGIQCNRVTFFKFDSLLDIHKREQVFETTLAWKILSAAISPDEKYVIATTSSCQLLIWDLDQLTHTLTNLNILDLPYPSSLYDKIMALIWFYWLGFCYFI